MPRRFFTQLSRRYDPKQDHPWYLKPFDFILAHPAYFATSRRAISGGVALGLFIGLFPVPGQTLIAILGAVLLRVNLPLTVLAVWITNPITFVPIFYFEYRIGAALLNMPVEAMPAGETMDWLTTELTSRLRPLLYGALLMATSAASIAYVAISAAWHILTLQRYRRRHKIHRTERFKRSELDRSRG